jgi:hypothetical protein
MPQLDVSGRLDRENADLRDKRRAVGQTCFERFAAREPAKRISPVNFPESVDQLPTNGTRGRVYGEPYRTADGGTVITVAKVRAGTSTPVGVFVVHGGTARWVPAIDTNRIALIGAITGLISAVIASVAVLRRPPWPDLSATSAAWLRR